MNTDFFGTIDRTSYFSNLNAGVKLIVSFTLIIAALIVRDPLTSGILFALELLGFILVGFRPVNVLARFWPILIAVITTGWSVAMLSAKSGTTILDLGFNSITTDSAAVGAAMMIRSLAMVLPTLAFVLTTTRPTSATPRTNLQTTLPVRARHRRRLAPRRHSLRRMERPRPGTTRPRTRCRPIPRRTCTNLRRAKLRPARAGYPPRLPPRHHHGSARLRCRRTHLGSCALLFAA